MIYHQQYTGGFKYIPTCKQQTFGSKLNYLLCNTAAPINSINNIDGIKRNSRAVVNIYNGQMYVVYTTLVSIQIFYIHVYFTHNIFIIHNSKKLFSPSVEMFQSFYRRVQKFTQILPLVRTQTQHTIKIRTYIFYYAVYCYFVHIYVISTYFIFCFACRLFPGTRFLVCVNAKVAYI